MDGNPDTSRSLGCFGVSPTSAGVSSGCFSSSHAPLRVSSSISVLFLGPVHPLVPFPPVFFLHWCCSGTENTPFWALPLLPPSFPSLLLSDWLLHRDDISLFIVVSLSPSLSLCIPLIPPAPPFLFTSMPPPFLPLWWPAASIVRTSMKNNLNYLD